MDIRCIIVDGKGGYGYVENPRREENSEK